MHVKEKQCGGRVPVFRPLLMLLATEVGKYN